MTLRNFMDHGAWISSHGGLYRFAREELQLFKNTVEPLESKTAELREAAEVDEDDARSWIRFNTGSLRMACGHHETAAILFLAASVEGFINYYGIRRFREDFYKRNIERAGITEKLSIICAVCFGQLLASDDPIWVALRASFDRRNQLAHPKARALTSTNIHIFVDPVPGGQPR